MTPEKKNNLVEKIMEHVQILDIAWYLKNEIEELLKYVHYYKIRNIFQNIDALKEYLSFLDKHSTEQIHKLEYENVTQELEQHQDISYYISKAGLEKVGEHKINQKIWENDYNLNYVMQGVKWFLLLTADEFCNASPTRMSINRMIWQKQMQKDEANGI